MAIAVTATSSSRRHDEREAAVQKEERAAEVARRAHVQAERAERAAADERKVRAREAELEQRQQRHPSSATSAAAGKAPPTAKEVGTKANSKDEAAEHAHTLLEAERGRVAHADWLAEYLRVADVIGCRE